MMLCCFVVVVNSGLGRLRNAELRLGPFLLPRKLEGMGGVSVGVRFLEIIVNTQVDFA